MNAKQIFKLFCKKIEIESNDGTLLISIKQQERVGKDKFKIHPVYKNSKLSSLNVEKSTLPGDTIIPIEAFYIVIASLHNTPGHILKRGNAQKQNIRIGDDGLEETTLEAIVAMNVFGKSIGETVFRRMPVISNILAHYKICEKIREKSQLKLIKK